LGNRASGARQEPSSPTAAHRKLETGSKPPGSEATRPQRRQRQLCKRCGALARRTGCASSSIRRKNLCHERLETQLVADAVVDLVDLQIPAGAILLLITFFQPVQTSLLFAESEIDRRECCRTDVLAFCKVFEFAQGLLGFRAVSGNRVSVAEVALIPRSGI